MPVKLFDSPDASAADLRTIGGGSIHRPLGYQEFDTNFIDIYPVGSVYMNATDDTNPEILLGFGTWERIKAGHTLLGSNYPAPSSADVRFKIKSAYKDKATVVIELVDSLDEIIATLGRRDPSNQNYTTEKLSARFFQTHIGQRITVNGLTGYQDKNPNGTHDITSGRRSITISAYEPDPNVMNSSPNMVAGGGHGIFTFRLGGSSDGIDAPFTYSVQGASAGPKSDDAWVSFLDPITNPIGESSVFGNQYYNSPKYNRIAITNQSLPAHQHRSDSIRQSFDAFGELGSDITRTTSSWKGELGKWFNSKKESTVVKRIVVNSHPDINKPSDKIPSGFSDTRSQDSYKENWSRIGEAGVAAGTQLTEWKTDKGPVVKIQGQELSAAGHNNLQPYVAVHMWKRIA